MLDVPRDSTDDRRAKRIWRLPGRREGRVRLWILGVRFAADNSERDAKRVVRFFFVEEDIGGAILQGAERPSRVDMRGAGGENWGGRGVEEGVCVGCVHGFDLGSGILHVI